jgi:hypothetical protein
MRLRSSYLLGGSVGEAALAVGGDKRAGDTTFLVRRMRKGMKQNHAIFWQKRCHRSSLMVVEESCAAIRRLGIMSLVC